VVTLSQARSLLCEWIQNPALRVHAESVAACMGALADGMDPANKERWQIAGLLHDLDWERHPTLDQHPFVAARYLKDNALVDDEIVRAILAHGDHTNTPRNTPMARALFAVDELSGFIVACCKVRPNGIADLEPKSIRKKLKDKTFAANVSREDIRKGIAELGVDETQFMQTCIDAMRANCAALGL
jgi:predicted hydrolase (HD superfamily)